MSDESPRTLEDALVYEVWRQDLPAIRRLLEAGANPNLPGRTWSSAMACAGENDSTGEILRLLVAAGGNVNLPDDHGQTPLNFAVDVAIDGACQMGRELIDWTVLGVLLDLGADVDHRDASGRTVADLASAYGQIARASFEEFLKTRAILE